MVLLETAQVSTRGGNTHHRSRRFGMIMIFLCSETSLSKLTCVVGLHTHRVNNAADTCDAKFWIKTDERPVQGLKRLRLAHGRGVHQTVTYRRDTCSSTQTDSQLVGDEARAPRKGKHVGKTEGGPPPGVGLTADDGQGAHTLKRKHKKDHQ